MRQRNARWLAGRKEKLEKEEEVSKKEKKKKEKLENQNKTKAKFDKEKKVWKEKKSSRITECVLILTGSCWKKVKAKDKAVQTE